MSRTSALPARSFASLRSSMEDADDVAGTSPQPTDINDLTFRQQVAVSAVSGTSAGLLIALLFCPFDVVRTNMAVHHISALGNAQKPALHALRGTISCTIKAVHAEHGFRGFYRGLGTTLIALAPTWGVYFGCYRMTKESLNNAYPAYRDVALVHVASAATAAAVTDVVTNPLWLIKTRLQTQLYRETTHHYRGIWHAATSIVRHEGFFALWRGLPAQFLGVFHVGIQFPLYEKLRVVFKGEKEEVSMKDTFFASIISKVVASTIAYPHEVLRMRFHFQNDADVNRYSGIGDAIKQIMRAEGLPGFYRGLSANLMRVIPSTAVTFIAYEELTKRCTSYLTS